MSWKRTGVASGDLREGLLHGTTAGNRAVVLVRLAGAVHAIDGACPHLGGSLAEGTAEQGKVTCPMHGATFDLLTGAVRADPFGVAPPEGAVEPVATFPVRITDGTIEVDVPES